MKLLPKFTHVLAAASLAFYAVVATGQSGSAAESLFQLPGSASQQVQQSSSPQTGGAAGTTSSSSTSNVPNCSIAQPGQVCVKDSTNGASGSESDTLNRDSSGVPRINSLPDEADGPALDTAEQQGNQQAQPNTQTSPNPQARPGIPSQAPSTTGQPQPAQSSSAPRQNTPLSEFQRFVLTSTGKRLPLFGHDLFLKPVSTFAPANQIPVTADYLIGPGDQIVVRAWGQVEVNYKATVDRNGSIYLPRVGEIHVSGVRYADLNAYLKQQIGRIFRNFSLDVSLSKLRSINVLVVGQVRQPGTYTVSGLSTLLNAVITSGGPNEYGSLRNIQLRRNGAVVKQLDFYDLLLKGKGAGDAPLQDGDMVFVPRVGPQLAISGSVPTPAIYEIKPGTKLSEALDLAGGLSPTAEGRQVIIERIQDHRTRQLERVNLDAAGDQTAMSDGDLVTVFPLQPKFENAIILRGNVAVPGRYPWKAGAKISDLIPSRDALLTRDYWLRLNASATVQPRGSEALHNDITHTAPEINWDYAVIQRLHTDHLQTDLIPFNLGKAIEHDPTQDLALEPGDIITIFSQADVKVPIEEQSKYIRLEGEMATSGVYKARPGETLRQLLQRIGGVTPNGYLYGAELTRISVQKVQQQKLDQLAERFNADVERSASYLSQNVTNINDAASLSSRIESERRLADRLKQIKATGRIVLDLKPDETSISAVPDLALEDGDRLIVPYTPATVSVLGAVNTQADFVFRPNRRVSEYLRHAGGITQTGDHKRLYILRANGSVTGPEAYSGLFNGSIDNAPIYPGDAIIVPEKINRTTFTKNLIEYSTILSQFALGAAAIKVLAP